jgi:hypothetical protein
MPKGATKTEKQTQQKETKALQEKITSLAKLEQTRTKEQQQHAALTQRVAHEVAQLAERDNSKKATSLAQKAEELKGLRQELRQATQGSTPNHQQALRGLEQQLLQAAESRITQEHEHAAITNQTLNTYLDSSDTSSGGVQYLDGQVKQREANVQGFVEGGKIHPGDITRAAQVGLAAAKAFTTNENAATCNISVKAAFKALTNSNEFGEQVANQMYQHCVSSQNFQEVKMEDTQALVNGGAIVIAAWENPTAGESGHVVLVVPGNEIQCDKWKCKVPMCMETGANHREACIKLSKNLGKNKKEAVKYFKYVGPNKK